MANNGAFWHGSDQRQNNAAYEEANNCGHSSRGSVPNNTCLSRAAFWHGSDLTLKTSYPPGISTGAYNKLLGIDLPCSWMTSCARLRMLLAAFLMNCGSRSSHAVTILALKSTRFCIWGWILTCNDNFIINLPRKNSPKIALQV